MNPGVPDPERWLKWVLGELPPSAEDRDDYESRQGIPDPEGFHFEEWTSDEED